jgi:hypothetical protein
MKLLVLAAVLIISSLILLSCKKDNPVPPEEQPQVSLSLEDVSCTEAWIKLITGNITLPVNVELLKDDSLNRTINLTTADTVLYIDSLLPNQTYSFHTIIQPSSHTNKATSAPISVTTLDTTTHNFNWQIYLFGEHSHSIIRDIAIIDENNIWAVGEIYMLDTLGQPDPKPYNLAQWNGNNWELTQIPFVYQGSSSYSPIYSIFVIDESDIWLGIGSMIHWDGNGFQSVKIPDTIFPSLANRIWGISDNNLYVVGNNGNITHYSGGVWSKEESGTNVNLVDIWRSSDGTIWTCGYSNDFNTTALLRDTGTGWEKVYEGNSIEHNNGYQIGPITGVWGTNEFRIYMMNRQGLYTQANNNELYLRKEIAEFSHFGYGVDGTDDNNIFNCGEEFVGHWNGFSYKECPEIYRDFRIFYSVRANGHTVCAGGTDYNGDIYSQAVIALSE